MAGRQNQLPINVPYTPANSSVQGPNILSAPLQAKQAGNKSSMPLSPS